jgi:O-antigen/teichoic acid export membrane protein
VSLIGLAVTPLVTRLYGPDAFGALGVFNSILAIIINIVSFAYPMAILLPRADSDAAGLARLSLMLSLAMIFVLAPFAFLFETELVAWLGLVGVPFFLPLVLAATAFNVAVLVAQQWTIRKLLFKIKAKVGVLQALLLGATKVAGGLIYPSALALVAITTVGLFTHAALLLWVGGRWGKAPLPLAERLETPMSELAKRHRDFPIYRAPEQILTAVSTGLPVLMLASLFDQTSAGFYTLSMVALGAPMMVIGSSVRDVFYPKLNQAALANQRTFPLVYKATASLFLVAMLPYAAVVALGPFLFGMVFGEEWAAAGEYARWLAPWYLSMLLNRPSVASMPVFSAQRFFLFYSIGSTLCRMLALAAGYVFFENAYVAIALFSMAAVASNIFLIFKALQLSRARDLQRKSGFEESQA